MAGLGGAVFEGASHAFRSKLGADASIGESAGVVRARTRRAIMWSSGQFTDSTATSRPARKHRTEVGRASGLPRVTAVSYPDERPAICSLRSRCSVQNHGTAL